MRKERTEPQDIWAEYERGVGLGEERGLYETVRQNENFYIGRQWEGVCAPDLDKPVINILRRVVSYFLSTICSDDVSAQVRVFGGGVGPETEKLLRAVSAEFDRVMEYNSMKSMNRESIRNAAVDGDACFYIWFDPERGDVARMSSGEIVAEEIDNTNVYFGNPQMADVQRQPWLILSRRMSVEDAREEGTAAGMSPEEAETITADDDPGGIGREAERGKVTVLLKFWKREGVVWFTKVTRNAVLKPPTNLGYRLYPVAWWSWDRVKNSSHGVSCLTGLIPNQIFINKLFAMAMEHVKSMAFPKVAYNQALLPGGWSNRIGEAIPVQGDPNLAIAANISGADMSAQVMQLIDKAIAYTRETMGASDAALGNVKPDNTSAIIAVQKSSAMPLEMQRMAFYAFVEQYIRIFLEIMRVDYGPRAVQTEGEDGLGPEREIVDFSALDALALKLEVDVGAGAYWSELMQVQTLDNLFSHGIITDGITYLEGIPDGYIKNKGKLIALLRERQGTEGGNQDGFLSSMRAGGGGGTP